MSISAEIFMAEDDFFDGYVESTNNSPGMK
jgi:hypothetical protein